MTQQNIHFLLNIQIQHLRANIFNMMNTYTILCIESYKYYHIVYMTLYYTLGNRINSPDKIPPEKNPTIKIPPEKIPRDKNPSGGIFVVGFFPGRFCRGDFYPETMKSTVSKTEGLLAGT